jgi:excisionase family DNA binding protein
MSAGPWGSEIPSHLQRVSCYAALMAEPFGLDAELIRVASRLHDVGMVAVADGILLKPGPLSPEERREMQDHTELGRAMLAGSGTELLDTASQIAWSHHERFDGGGYPCGDAGERIPLPGRIAAVADAFDAMTTDRVYRAAPGVEPAVATLREERGRQFDPKVVDAFLDSLDAALELRARYAPPAVGFPALGPAEEDTQVTLQAAANALSISPSRLRRWADEGRIESMRTAGGHRRFPLQAVRRLAAERGVRPSVRPIEPPGAAVPALADLLAAQGRQVAAAAAAAIYRDGPKGWFASDTAGPDLRDWLSALAASAASGRYPAALQATDVLMRRAHLNAATLLERHAFLERFAQVAVRALARAGGERDVMTDTRRLFTSLQQSLLESGG